MSSEYDSIEKAVKDFVAAQSGARFKGSELLDYVSSKAVPSPKAKSKKGAKKPTGRELGEMALDILNSMESRVLADPATGSFQSAEGFFKGALFRATPSKEELEEGILLPYPRLAFFCNPELCGAEDISISPSDAPGMKTIAAVDHAMAFEALAETHILVGRNALADYLVAEDHSNLAAVRGEKGAASRLKLAVFDMKDYYQAVGFHEGESLVFEVLDWTAGRYSFRRESVRAAEERRRSWISALERCLAKTWKDFGDYLEIADQVATALFIDACEGGKLCNSPDVGLDEAHKLFREVALVQNGGEWALVPSEELSAEAAKDDMDSPDVVKELSPEDFSVSKGKSSLDELLKEIKFPYPMPIFQAMIFDEISNGCESFEEFNSRYIAGLELTPVDDAQEAAFLNFAEELWEDSMERYSASADQAKAPLRTRVLELAKSCAETLSSIVARTSSSEKDRILEIYRSHHESVASLQRDILETLALLNSDSPLPEEGDDYENLELRLGDMEDLWDSILRGLEPIASSRD